MRTPALVLAVAAVLAGCTLVGSGSPAERTADGTGHVPVPDVIATGPTGRTEIGQVVRVTDGDTIRVEIEGVEERVRYIGVDTPESVDPRKTIQPYAVEADRANRRLVEGREVVLEIDVSERDRYGRLLRYVWVDAAEGWVLVNFQLVSDGYASAVTYPPDVKYQALLLDAERAAREAAVGMWGP